MNKYEIVKKIESFAPLDTQEKWDASGWIVDLKSPKINKIMFALTITDKVFAQAKAQKCDMIISHHPLFFVPLEYKEINMYCAHTNLDRAKGGTTDLILKNLGLKGIGEDFVRKVELDKPINVLKFRDKLKTISPNLRWVNNHDVKEIQTIAFCAGSGSEFINETECDAFVTGDLKFHTALDSMPVVFDIGHFESEIFAPRLLKEITEVGEKGVIADEKSPFLN